MSDYVVKENEGFRLRLSKKACARPEGLYSIEFVQESLKDGEVSATSTYQFFMTNEEILSLVKGLTK